LWREHNTKKEVKAMNNNTFPTAAIFAATIALLWGFIVSPAQAQPRPPCANRADFLKHLSENYQEAPVAMGLTANGGLLEVVASEDGSWTIIVTMPNGMSCGVASGMNWESTAKAQTTDPDA